MTPATKFRMVSHRKRFTATATGVASWPSKGRALGELTIPPARFIAIGTRGHGWPRDDETRPG